MRSRGVFWVLPSSLGDAIGRLPVAESGAGEDPGSVRQRMDCFDLAGFGGEPQRLRRDLQELRGLAQVEPRLDPILGGLNTGMR